MGQLEETARALLARCTLRISTPSASATGFWVGPKTILTCSHVVTDYNGVLEQNIFVRCYGTEGPAYTASAQLAKTSGVDLALLTVNGPPADHPCVFLHNFTSTGANLTSYGYPSGKPDGDQATYRVEGSSFVDGHSLLKLKLGQIDFGASGSPVLDDRYRSVCAVVTLTRDVNTDLGGYATQIDFAFREWPELGQIQTEAFTFSRLWYHLIPLPKIYEFQGQEEQRLLRDELDRHTCLRHPVTPRFEAFIKSRPWHMRIESQCKNLIRAITEMKESISDFPQIDEPDYDANYDQILRGLSRIIQGPLGERIDSALRELEGQKDRLMQSQSSSGAMSPEAEIRDRLRSLRAVKAMFRDLESETTDPAFGKCLLIMGEVGSGKTHFLTSLLAAGPEARELERAVVVIIRPRQLANTPLLDHLLRTVRERTGVEWENLAEFDRYLQSQPYSSRIIAAIDDLHTIPDVSAFLDELKRSVSQNTQLHSLYWVITIEHKEYIQVASARRFWQEYGFIDDELRSHSAIGDPTQLGPWIALDELNYQEQTGIEIVRQGIRQAQNGGLDGLEKSLLTENLQRLVSTPFIAWILLQCRELLSEPILVNLNFVQFVSRYWDAILPRLTSDERVQQRLKSCVGLITSYLVQRGFAPPIESELSAFVVAQAKGRSDLAEQRNTEQALALLERSRILRSFQDKDPKLEVVRRIDLCFDAFWNWKLGQRLKYEFDRAKKGRSLSFVETWFRRRIGDLSQGVGILEFFLLEAGTNGGVELWSGAARSLKLPPGAVWFGAAKLPPAEREKLTNSLLGPDLRLRDKHQDLFGLIYFVSCLSGSIPSSLGIVGLLRVLRPHYGALNEAALSDYFVFTIERLLPQLKTLAELEEVMLALDGCEVMGVAEQVADLTVDAMRHLQEDLALSIDVLMKYLSRTAVSGSRTSSQPEDRATYLDWLIASFCKALVYEKETSAFDSLSDRGWYAWNSATIRLPLLRRMNKEANFAFGDWFRETFPTPIEDYTAMVSKAANSTNISEREAAFFMIRHTRATHKISAVRVDRKFKPVLERVASDPHLNWLVSKYDGFFRINQIASLGAQRTLRPRGAKKGNEDP
jgi:hypothetical protein